LNKPKPEDQNQTEEVTWTEVPFLAVSTDTKLGKDVILSPFVNLWGCEIGDGTTVGAYAEIGQGAKVGKNCAIGAYAFIPPGVSIGDNVFIGPRVTFTNDRWPKAKNPDWECEETIVRDGASIGAGCTILPGLIIGQNAMVGAGTCLTKNVEKGMLYYDKRMGLIMAKKEAK
jgi:acetyltransferase-like isoleucine patch superfamily enzyme